MLGEYQSMRARAICAVLIVVNVFGPVAANAADPTPLPPGVDIAKVQQLKQNKVKDYFNGDFKSEKQKDAFESDLQAFAANAKALGVFPQGTRFADWWAKNRTKMLTPEKLKQAQEMPMSQFVTALFIVHAADNAKELDKADAETKKKRKDDQPTAGDISFLTDIGNVNSSAWGTVLIGGAGVVIGAVAAKVFDVFFHGPIAQIMNTSLEPLVRPVRERVDQIVNTHWAPKLVKWALFVTGEGARRRKALKLAAQGEELKGDLLRYQHPAIAVADFAKDTESFFQQMLAADYRWRGWMAPELARARTTGFELLYHQYRLLGEQLTGYQNALNINRLLHAQMTLPEMLKAGAQQGDIDEFTRLTKEKHEIALYHDLRSPEIATVDEKLKRILEKWTAAKVPVKAIHAYYENELETLRAKDRPAFLLASVLDGERYFQENNLALNGLPLLQSWQEQAREMTGFYAELEKNKENIQRFFDKKGLGYDVRARIDERGFPLGGPARPKDVAPITDCVLDYLKLAGA